MEGEICGVAIVGMPKAGTSSLFSWLGAHPGIQGAVPKETFFLMDEDHPLAGSQGRLLSRDGPGGYEYFFQEPRAGRVRLDATTHYFYQRVARDYLAGLTPQPLVVMVLREPAARVWSSFRFTRDNLANCSRALSFDRYVECLLAGETDRLKRYYNAQDSLYVATREIALNQYSVWLDWWRERLAEDRLRVILFEELAYDPKRVMQLLCGHLGVDGRVYDDFEFRVYNRTTPIRYQRAHRVALRLASRLPTGLVAASVKRRYLAWQERAAPAEAGCENGLGQLRKHFGPWNRRLAQDYGLDLRRWWGAAACG